MMSGSRRKELIGIAIVIGVFLSLILFDRSSLQAEWELQSLLPTRPQQLNPNFISSGSGGRIYCGQQWSSVWLDVPIGFTSEGGAEFHCDPTGPLSQEIGISGAWYDRGYLIAFYPIQTPILKPFYLVFEIDPARADEVCSSCFAARYFDIGHGRWQDLPLVYDTATSRVQVSIAQFLPTSAYPGYQDRFLVALFVRELEPTSSPTVFPTPSVVPTATYTPAPEFSPALSPSPSRTSTFIPSTPSSMPEPTFSSTPSLSPAPTSVPKSPTPSPASIETPTQVLRVSGPSRSSSDTLLLVLAILLAIITLVLVGIVIYLIRKQRDLRSR